MNKADVDEYARKRPFLPFELKLVNGRRYRFSQRNQFLVSTDHVITVDRRSRTVFINFDRIATMGPVTKSGKRRPRKHRGR